MQILLLRTRERVNKCNQQQAVNFFVSLSSREFLPHLSRKVQGQADTTLECLHHFNYISSLIFIQHFTSAEQ